MDAGVNGVEQQHAGNVIKMFVCEGAQDHAGVGVPDKDERPGFTGSGEQCPQLFRVLAGIGGFWSDARRAVAEAGPVVTTGAGHVAQLGQHL